MSGLIKIAGWSGAPRASIIFVHGLGGHAYDTWRRARRGEAPEDVTFWPLWLAEDVDGISVYTMAYEAPPSNWLGTSMPLQDRAVNVLEEPGLKSGPIAFICHSLGGLIVKQILLDLPQQKERRQGPARPRNPSRFRRNTAHRVAAGDFARSAAVFCVAIDHRPDACRQ